MRLREVPSVPPVPPPDVQRDSAASKTWRRSPRLTSARPPIDAPQETGKATKDYEDYFKEEDDSKRTGNYTDVVNKYYDLATSFYEYGWGESFHFAHRYKWETLRESIVRHEHFLASKLDVGPGDKVLDVGCGVGGPLREIAAFTGASVTGLNNNAFQIKRGEELNRATGRHDNCDFVKADFMNIPKPDNTYDAVYQIEATCHAPDAVGCYSEIFRVLKPGVFSRRTSGASPTRTTLRTRSTERFARKFSSATVFPRRGTRTRFWTR